MAAQGTPAPLFLFFHSCSLCCAGERVGGCHFGNSKHSSKPGQSPLGWMARESLPRTVAIPSCSWLDGSRELAGDCCGCYVVRQNELQTNLNEYLSVHSNSNVNQQYEPKGGSLQWSHSIRVPNRTELNACTLLFRRSRTNVLCL